jgi:hypothetical protein
MVFLVHGHQPGARAGLNRHVADGHATLHRQRPDRRTTEFDRVAGAAGGADLANDGQHDILGRDTGGGLAVDPHQHVLRLLGEQGLGGEHVFDLAGADPMGQGAECAVGGGVGVAADHRHAGQRGAALRADDMHDALALRQEREERCGAEFMDVGCPAW